MFELVVAGLFGLAVTALHMHMTNKAMEKQLEIHDMVITNKR